MQCKYGFLGLPSCMPIYKNKTTNIIKDNIANDTKTQRMIPDKNIMYSDVDWKKHYK